MTPTRLATLGYWYPWPGHPAAPPHAPQATFNSTQPGQRNDWREVEGAYVLFPPNGRTPAAVAHFLGGAFVGAAPQVGPVLGTFRGTVPTVACVTRRGKRSLGGS